MLRTRRLLTVPRGGGPLPGGCGWRRISTLIQPRWSPQDKSRKLAHLNSRSKWNGARKNSTGHGTKGGKSRSPEELLQHLEQMAQTPEIKEITDMYQSLASSVKSGYYKRSLSNRKLIAKRTEEGQRLSSTLAEISSLSIQQRLQDNQTSGRNERDSDLIGGIVTVVDNAILCHRGLPKQLASATFQAVSAQQNFLEPMESILLMRGFSATQHLTPKMFRILRQALVDGVGSLNSQQISMTMNLMAKEGIKDIELASVLARKAVTDHHLLSEQGLSQMLRSCAQLDLNLPWLFSSMAPVCRKRLDEFTDQGLSNLIWAYATSSVEESSETNSFYVSVAEEYANRVQSPTAGKKSEQALSLSIGLWSLDKLGLARTSQLNEILDQVLNNAALLREASTSDIVRFLIVYSNSEVETDPSVLVSEIVRRCNAEFVSREDAVTLLKHWERVCSKLEDSFGEQLEAIFPSLCRLVSRNVSKWDPRTATTVFKAVGRHVLEKTVRPDDPSLSCFMSCVGKVLTQRNRFDSLQLSIIVNTAAKVIGSESRVSLIMRSDEDFSALPRMLSSVGRELVSRDFVKSGPETESGGRVSSAVQRCSRALDQISAGVSSQSREALEVPIAVSTLIWSFAHAYSSLARHTDWNGSFVVDKELLGVLSSHARILAPLMTPWSLANTAFGIATSGLPALNLFGAVGKELLARASYSEKRLPSECGKALAMQGFGPDEIASLSWSFTQQGFTDAPLYELFTAYCVEGMSQRGLSMTTRHAVLVAWSASCAEVFNTKFLQSLVQFIHQYPKLSQLELSQLFTVQQAVRLLLPDNVSDNTIIRLENTENTSISESSDYSDVLRGENLERFQYRRIAGEEGISPHWEKPYGSEGPSASFRFQLPKPVSQQASQAFLELHQYSRSNLQGNVAKALKHLETKEPVEEFLTPLHLSLDFAWPNQRVALEINGPSHFLPGIEPPVKSPPTRLKERLLAAQGWDLRTLQYYEWSGRTAFTKREWLLSEEEQYQLLREKLPESVLGEELRNAPSGLADRSHDTDPHMEEDINFRDFEDMACSVYGINKQQLRHDVNVNSLRPASSGEYENTDSSYRTAQMSESKGERSAKRFNSFIHDAVPASESNAGGRESVDAEFDEMAKQASHDSTESVQITEHDIREVYGKKIDEELDNPHELDVESAVSQLEKLANQDTLQSDLAQESTRHSTGDLFDMSQHKDTVHADFVINESGKVVERQRRVNADDNRTMVGRESSAFESDVEDIEEIGSGFSMASPSESRSPYSRGFNMDAEARELDRDMLMTNNFFRQYQEARDAEKKGDPMPMEELLEKYAKKMDISLSSDDEQSQFSSPDTSNLSQRDRTVLEALKFEYANRNLTPQEQQEAENHLRQQLGKLESHSRQKLQHGLNIDVDLSDIDKAFKEEEQLDGGPVNSLISVSDSGLGNATSVETPLLASMNEEAFEEAASKEKRSVISESVQDEKVPDERRGRSKKRRSFALKTPQNGSRSSEIEEQAPDKIGHQYSKEDAKASQKDPSPKISRKRRRQRSGDSASNTGTDESFLEEMHENAWSKQLDQIGDDDPEWRSLSSEEKERQLKHALADVMGSMNLELSQHGIDSSHFMRLLDEAYFGGFDSGPSSTAQGNDVVSKLRAALKRSIESRVPNDSEYPETTKFLRPMALRGEAENAARILKKGTAVEGELNTPTGGLLFQLLRKTGYGHSEEMKNRIREIQEDKANQTGLSGSSHLTQMNLSQLDSLLGLPSHEEIKDLQQTRDEQDSGENDHLIDLAEYSEEQLSDLIRSRADRVRRMIGSPDGSGNAQYDERGFIEGPNGIKTSPEEMDAFKRLLMGYKISSDGVLESDNESPEWEHLLQRLTTDLGVTQEDQPDYGENVDKDIADIESQLGEESSQNVNKSLGGNYQQRSRSNRGRRSDIKLERATDQLEDLDSSVANLENLVQNQEGSNQSNEQMEPEDNSQDHLWDDLLGDDEIRSMVSRLQSSGTPQSVVEDTIKEGYAEYSQTPGNNFHGSRGGARQKAAQKWEQMSDSDEREKDEARHRKPPGKVNRLRYRQESSDRKD
eukprot:gb/GECG01006157.1/.p1 GENE.gb/GECG01006157.1/~~gb/GECG01006157.1/.p1  ORF type:complete len:2071 (+),score=304.49 gb/GECG01006157.1/:1-6213(+)